MKVSILLLLFFFVSCGKSNESGKPTGSFDETNAYSVSEEELRSDFINTAHELLRTYKIEIRNYFAPGTLALIRNRLQNGEIYMDATVDWMQVRRNRRMFERLVFHELLVMGEVEDTNFQYTDYILRTR